MCGRTRFANDGVDIAQSVTIEILSLFCIAPALCHRAGLARAGSASQFDSMQHGYFSATQDELFVNHSMHW